MRPQSGSLGLAGFFVFVLMLGTLTSCHQSTVGQPSLKRLAILPLNILTDTPDPDEMRIGGAIVLQQELLSSPNIFSQAVENEPDGLGFGATESIRIAVSRVQGQLHGELTERGYASGKTQRVLTANGVSYIALLHQLALQLDPHALPYSTQNDDAARAFAASLRNSDPAQKKANLQRAIQLDPHFGFAYLSLIELSVGQSDSPKFFQAALANQSGFTSLDRARLNASSMALSSASLQQQRDAIAAVVRLAPNDVDSLFTLGVWQFLGSDFKAGEESLRHASALAPERAEIRHQLALGLIAAGQFDAAAQILQTLSSVPAVPPELATCLLLRHDAPGANKVIDQYLAGSKDQLGPTVPFVKANWIAISQGPEAGAAILASSSFPSSDLASMASSQQAIWLVAAGQSNQAASLAAAALQTAASPTSKAYAFAAAVALPNPPHIPPSWTGLVLQPELKASIQAYTFFLRKNYSEAVTAWQIVLKLSGSRDLRARAMLAASLDRAGRSSEATQIKVEPFAPSLLGADPYAVISFAEMRRLLRL